jgi:hypothetical protein
VLDVSVHALLDFGEQAFQITDVHTFLILQSAIFNLQ